MPPVKQQIKCPNCQAPIIADIEQVFDVAADPQAKARFLSGQFNLAKCPSCGFQGNVATPLVYHDPDKELLLTFFPQELGLKTEERERRLGALIKPVVDALPSEQRKGYLLNPQPVLTLQGLVERVLEADGITKEMVEAQQKRMDLIQRLLTISEDDRLAEVAKEEDQLIDADFFLLLERLLAGGRAGGDQEATKKLTDLQAKLLPITTYGKQVQAQTKEMESAIKDLQEAGDQLTREKLLELLIDSAANETRLSTLVSLARPGLDYEFFQKLSERIDGKTGEEKQRLTDLRERLLELTSLLDKQLEARFAQAKQNLETLLGAEDIPQTLKQNLPAIDDFFIQVLNQEYEEAKKGDDKKRLEKLTHIVDLIKELSAPGPEAEFIQELLQVPDDKAREELLKANREKITPQFTEALSGLLLQLEAGEDQELTAKVRSLYRATVRISMETSFKKKD